MHLFLKGGAVTKYFFYRMILLAAFAAALHVFADSGSNQHSRGLRLDHPLLSSKETPNAFEMRLRRLGYDSSVAKRIAEMRPELAAHGDIQAVKRGRRPSSDEECLQPFLAYRGLHIAPEQFEPSWNDAKRASDYKNAIFVANSINEVARYAWYDPKLETKITSENLRGMNTHYVRTIVEFQIPLCLFKKPFDQSGVGQISPVLMPDARPFIRRIGYYRTTAPLGFDDAIAPGRMAKPKELNADWIKQDGQDLRWLAYDDVYNKNGTYIGPPVSRAEPNRGRVRNWLHSLFESWR